MLLLCSCLDSWPYKKHQQIKSKITHYDNSSKWYKKNIILVVFFCCIHSWIPTKADFVPLCTVWETVGHLLYLETPVSNTSGLGHRFQLLSCIYIPRVPKAKLIFRPKCSFYRFILVVLHISNVEVTFFFFFIFLMVCVYVHEILPDISFAL